jgi:DNA-binding response OmpR family regulator
MMAIQGGKMPSVDFQSRPAILLCQPDHDSVHSLAKYLGAKGFAADFISESDRAVDQIITQVPDVVLLDSRILPAGGYDVCREVRPYYNGPILFLGWEQDEAAQLLAFERGADEFIAMPASPAFLSARISAHLSRGRISYHQIRIGQLVVDASRRVVVLAGQPVDLTTVQFDLLWYLAKRSGRVVSRQELYKALFQEKYNGYERSVDVYISRIRNQLGDDPENPSYLKTVRGVGYLFVGVDE